MKEPKQVQHTPAMSMTLKEFAKTMGIGLPDPDQGDKNPECKREAGTLDCLNAADPMCDDCDWWERQSSEYDDPDEWRDEDNGEDWV